MSERKFLLWEKKGGSFLPLKSPIFRRRRGCGGNTDVSSKKGEKGPIKTAETLFLQPLPRSSEGKGKSSHWRGEISRGPGEGGMRLKGRGGRKEKDFTCLQEKDSLLSKGGGGSGVCERRGRRMARKEKVRLSELEERKGACRRHGKGKKRKKQARRLPNGKPWCR